MNNWSTNWKSSKNPTKQRKYTRNAPIHIKSKLLQSPLSKELKNKYGKNSIRLKKGDKVKIMRGQFKGKTGKVDRVNVKKTKAYITGIESIKKDGSKTMYPIHSSNIMITELNLDDKKRLTTKENKDTKKTDKKPEVNK